MYLNRSHCTLYRPALASCPDKPKLQAQLRHTLAHRLQMLKNLLSLNGLDTCSNAVVMLLQDCSLQGGQIQANASCISGLVCCDAKCAAAFGASSLQVSWPRLIHLKAAWK